MIDWPVVRIGEVTAEVSDRAGVGVESETVSVYGVDRSRGLTETAKYQSQDLSRYKRVRPGSFVYNPMRLNIGSIGFCAMDQRPGLVSPDYVVFECDRTTLDPTYLSYVVQSPVWRTWTASRGAGSVRVRIYFRELASLELPLPPVREQLAIVSVLRVLEDKIDLNKRMNETLDQLTQQLFAKRFVSDDSRDWPMTAISEICTTQYGYTASAISEERGPHLLRVTDINKHPWIDWAAVPHCEIDQRKLEKYALEYGDIVVSRMADPGKSAIIEDEVRAVFASYLVRLKTRSTALAYFLYGFLKSSEYASYANGAMSGSVQRNMNARVITAATLRLPPESEIEAYFQAIRPLRTRLSHNVRESRTLAELRDALLPKLVSGELRVRETESHSEDRS